MHSHFLSKNKLLSKLKFRKLNRDKKRKGLGRSILLWSAYIALGCCFVAALIFAWFSKDLPTPSKIAGRKPAISTKIYDRTGETLLYETGDQKRTIVNSDQISKYLKDATIATEDSNFYKHHGVDIKAIAAATFEKLTGRRRITRGGSTITQQYIKIALLTSNRSLTRKIKEAILAVELEFMFSKEEILTMYLNEIPYGNATAGAEAASRTYYGKPAKDLTIAEAATLAAIPNAPTYYSPYGTHVDKLINRRDYVLDQMVKSGKVSSSEAEEAKKQDTTTLGVAIKPRHDSMLAPHFAMYVLEEVADKYGEEKIQKEGLKIITTLDYEKQRAAEEAISEGVPKLSK
jgi:penicillin-binding protein 1A